jgi:hypothetical protein
MYTELEKVMAHSVDTGLYLEAMGENVFGKKSSDGVVRTIGFLKQLYGFELNNPVFIAFEYFWRISDSHERPLIAFLYAVNHDFLLAESIDVLQKVAPGTKVTTGNHWLKISQVPGSRPVLLKARSGISEQSLKLLTGWPVLPFSWHT